MFTACLALLLVVPQQRTDTLVLRGNGDVPATSVRSLVAVWKTGDQFEFGDIADLAIAPDGRVYVWDFKTPALVELSADGSRMKQIARKGAGPGEYDRNVNGIAVRPDGKVVAWDGGNTRLNVYGRDGQSLATWRLIVEGRMFAFRGLTATLDNRVLMKTMVRAPNERDYQAVVITFDSSGVPRDTMKVPRVLGEETLVAQRFADGRGRSERYLPYGVSTQYAASPLGHIVSGPGRPYVVHTMFNGRPIRVERTITPVPVSRDERDQQRAQAQALMRNTQPNWTWTGPDVPGTKPAYTGFMIGTEGRIWVQLSVESEKYEPGMSNMPGYSSVPVVKYRAKEQRWDIFEPDGRFVARVSAPLTFRVLAARADTVWGMMRNADDVPTVAKMRVAPAR